jgi:hypothetical protein
MGNHTNVIWHDMDDSDGKACRYTNTILSLNHGKNDSVPPSHYQHKYNIP